MFACIFAGLLICVLTYTIYADLHNMRIFSTCNQILAEKFSTGYFKVIFYHNLKHVYDIPKYVYIHITEIRGSLVFYDYGDGSIHQCNAYEFECMVHDADLSETDEHTFNLNSQLNNRINKALVEKLEGRKINARSGNMGMNPEAFERIENF